jgi:hypothetical protein
VLLASGDLHSAREHLEAACRFDPDDEATRTLRDWIADAMDRSQRTGEGSAGDGTSLAALAADRRGDGSEEAPLPPTTGPEELGRQPERRAAALLRRLAAGRAAGARAAVEDAPRIDESPSDSLTLLEQFPQEEPAPEAALPKPDIHLPAACPQPGSAASGAFSAQVTDWDSFEALMRRRQAASYVRIARRSIEAGRQDEAARAVAEIERVDPGDPALPSLRGALGSAEPMAASSPNAPDLRPGIDRAEAAAPAQSRLRWRDPRRTLAAAVACVVVSASAGHAVVRVGGLEALSSFATALLLSGDTRAPLGPVALDRPAAGLRPGPWAAPGGEPVAVTVERREVSLVPAPESSPMAREAPRPTLPESTGRVTLSAPEVSARPEPQAVAVSSPIHEVGSPVVADTPVEAGPDSEPVVAVALLPPPPVSTEVPRGRRDTTAESGAVSEPGSGAPVEAVPAAAAPAAPVREDVGQLEHALRRYATAYRQLDARAAKAVWPSVNERALARAFDGLASQDLVLERCHFDVAGQTATASCSGRASYVPRVGSRGVREEAREWSFTLKKVEDEWRIAAAETRTQ